MQKVERSRPARRAGGPRAPDAGHPPTPVNWGGERVPFLLEGGPRSPPGPGGWDPPPPDRTCGRKLRWDLGNGEAETPGARPRGSPGLTRCRASSELMVPAGAGRSEPRAGGAAVSPPPELRVGGGSRGLGRARDAGRGPEAGATGRGGAKPAASVTRTRASLSQGSPSTCRGTSQCGASGCRTLGRKGEGMRPGLLSRRRPEALPREGRKWAGPGRVRGRSAGAEIAAARGPEVGGTGRCRRRRVRAGRGPGS